MKSSEERAFRDSYHGLRSCHEIVKVKWRQRYGIWLKGALYDC